jgi:tRNA dimethylallyltransferase
LDGHYNYEVMVEKAITATRQLAKRQMTWLRGMRNVENFDCLNKDLVSEVLKTLATVRIF